MGVYNIGPKDFADVLNEKDAERILGVSGSSKGGVGFTAAMIFAELDLNNECFARVADETMTLKESA